MSGVALVTYQTQIVRLCSLSIEEIDFEFEINAIHLIINTQTQFISDTLAIFYIENVLRLLLSVTKSKLDIHNCAKYMLIRTLYLQNHYKSVRTH